MAIRAALFLLLVLPASGGEGLPGIIKSALVVYPPYEGVTPTILFQFADGRTRTVRPGEALVTRPDPRRPLLGSVPVAYRFLGCERDGRTGATYFVFDVACDGKKIVELRWKQAAVRPWQPKGRYVVSDKGVRRPTPEGWVYLGKRHRDLLADVDFKVYRGAKRTGLRIVRIRGRSVVHELGLKAGDVILTVNGYTPRHGAHALALVRRELRHGILSVRIRRGTEVHELLFDTRPPATR
ncbi:MAG: hypothetical protein ACYTDU_09320 [Planctomycetota bacterium]|jgi:hypothetical protein